MSNTYNVRPTSTALIDGRWHFVWQGPNGTVGHRPVKWWWPADVFYLIRDRHKIRRLFGKRRVG